MQLTSDITEEVFFETAEELKKTLVGAKPSEKDLLKAFHKVQDGFNFLTSRYRDWWMTFEDSDRIDVAAQGKNPLWMVLDRFGLQVAMLPPGEMEENGFAVSADAHRWEANAVNVFWNRLVRYARACPMTNGTGAF